MVSRGEQVARPQVVDEPLLGGGRQGRSESLVGEPGADLEVKVAGAGGAGIDRSAPGEAGERPHLQRGRRGERIDAGEGRAPFAHDIAPRVDGRHAHGFARDHRPMGRPAGQVGDERVQFA